MHLPKWSRWGESNSRHRVTSAALCHLSYTGKSWSGVRNSNPRSSPWQGNVLPLDQPRINGSEKRNRTSTASFKDSRPTVNRSRIKLGWGGKSRTCFLSGQSRMFCLLNFSPTSNWLQRQDSNLHISALTVQRITFLLRWNIPKRRRPQTLFRLGVFTLSHVVRLNLSQAYIRVPPCGCAAGVNVP